MADPVTPNAGRRAMWLLEMYSRPKDFWNVQGIVVAMQFPKCSNDVER